MFVILLIVPFECNPASLCNGVGPPLCVLQHDAHIAGTWQPRALLRPHAEDLCMTRRPTDRITGAGSCRRQACTQRRDRMVQRGRSADGPLSLTPRVSTTPGKAKAMQKVIHSSVQRRSPE